MASTTDANKKLTEKLNEYGNSDPPLAFSVSDSKAYENILTYIRSCADMPQTTHSKTKTIAKLSGIISRYHDNSIHLIKACNYHPSINFFRNHFPINYNDSKYVYLFVSNVGHSKHILYKGQENRYLRRFVRKELILRLEHNQFIIEAKKSVIAKILEGSYQQEFTASAIKFMKHCNQMNDQNAPKLEYPTDVMNINVLDLLINNKIVEEHTVSPELMSEEDNTKYRELMEGLPLDQFHDFGI